MKRYYYFFGYSPSWSWAWDDMDSEVIEIEAEDESSALEYGKQVATCIVTHCWPELPDQQIKGFLADKPDSECELSFKVSEVPSWPVWREWEARKYGDSFSSRISNAAEMKLRWHELKKDAFTIASHWIPNVERKIIRRMSPRQHFILSAFCLKSFQNENGNASAPSQPLYELLQSVADRGEQNFSPALLRDMYSAQWAFLYPEILQNLRTWKFPNSIYVQAKTEELLIQMDRLLQEIMEAGPTFFPALVVWEMTQRYQDWELNQVDAFKSSGIVFFPLIAENNDEARQWSNYLSRPSAWKLALMIAIENFPGELLLGAAIMLAVAIYAVILYFIPFRWQWPIFVLLVLATVAVAVILWKKYHKPKPEAKK